MRQAVVMHIMQKLNVKPIVHLRNTASVMGFLVQQMALILKTIVGFIFPTSSALLATDLLNGDIMLVPGVIFKLLNAKFLYPVVTGK